MNKTKEEIDMWKEVAVRFSELYNRGPAVVLPTQEMFPNCRKYKKCCTDDSAWWARLQVKLSSIEYKEQEIKQLRPPKDFEENIYIDKHVDWEEKEEHGV